MEKEMKLWLLRPRDDLDWKKDDGTKGTNPWEPWYDKAFGFVVRAVTEEEARVIATEDGGDEKSEPSGSFSYNETSRKDAWTSPEFSTCVELTTDGKKEIVIRDFASA